MKLRFISGVVILLALSAALCSCDGEKREKMKKGEEVIAKIEAFKKERGRLPENEAEMGVKVDEGGPIFYHKVDSNRYKLDFAIGFDDGYSYDSETKEWKRDGGR